MNFATDRQQCLEKLIWATEQLGVKVGEAQLSKIAELIVQAMSGPWRYFHTPAHIFEVGGSENAIEVLAALFHDLVYVQVDCSINLNLTYYIAPFIREVREKLLIREQAELPADTMFEIVATVFGFVPGQALSPMAGENEFLSSLVTAKVLEPFLSPDLIVQIVACIEATIPFRPKSDRGLTASDRLYLRLTKTNNQFNLGLTEGEIRQTLKRSVRLANRDVGGFARSSSARFLDNTWSLLPETNHHLKNTGSYTVRKYRIALEKMEGFLNFLKPELIFSQFEGEPDEPTYQGLLRRARKNLAVGRLYLGSKLVTIALLEALSRRLGKDIPLAMMVGELPASGFSVVRLKDFLPAYIPNAYRPKTDLESEVLELLEKGRCQTSTYDLQDSPLTTFMVKSIGFDEIRYLGEQAKKFFQGTVSAEEFLAECSADVLRTITDAVSKLMDSRKAALHRVALNSFHP